MDHVNDLKKQLPAEAKDLKLNLGGTLGESSLNDAQKWGTAVACALACRNEALSKAILGDAAAVVDEAVLEDGRAAAALMGMNNIYYRFRHMVGSDEYNKIPARLRMTRIAKPATNKVDFELFCLAVSAINGCEACIRSHEKVVIDGGLSQQQVNDAVRIAATLHGVACSLEFPTA